MVREVSEGGVWAESEVEARKATAMRANVGAMESRDVFGNVFTENLVGVGMSK